MHAVAVVAYDGAPSFALSIPGEVLGKDVLGDRYRVELVAAERGVPRTSGGWRIPTGGRLDRLEAADTVIVPGWRELDRPAERPLLEGLARAAARGARVVSLCTGAFALADAGLLDGRRATTHWQYARELARRHPRVRVDANALYVDEGSVLTSAGVAAGIDLCLHLVRRDHGQHLAGAVARRLVMSPHREGGQAQYIERPVPPTPGDSLGDVMDWMKANLDRPLQLSTLAERSHLSVRQFTRRFHAATGTAPYEWLLGERVRAAQEMLETTALPIEVVARRCGFATAIGMRQQFQRRLGMSPTSYRASFNAGS